MPHTKRLSRSATTISLRKGPKRERRVSWKASEQVTDGTGTGFIYDEASEELLHDTNGWDISQWPYCDPLVARRRSSIRLAKDSSSRILRAVRCCGRKKATVSYDGVMDGPHVKINTNIFPIDYFSNYQGKIKPKSTAIVSLDDNTRYTFEELNRLSDILALVIKPFIVDEMTSSTASFPLGMLETNYEPCVGVAMGPNEKTVLTILAIWKLGMAYLPLRTHESPVFRISAIISSVLPLMVIGTSNDPILEGAGKSLKRGKCLIVQFEDLWKRVEEEKRKYSAALTKGERSELLQIETISARVATREPREHCSAVFHRFTSKGEVTVTNVRNTTVWNRLHAEWRNFPYSSKNARAALYTSVDSHEFLGQMLAPLLAGVTLVVLDTYNLYGFLEKVRTWKIERLIVFPALLRALLNIMKLTNIKNVQTEISRRARGSLLFKKNKFQFPCFSDSVKYWFVSGLTLRRELAILFFKNAPKTARLVNLYGSKDTLEMICFEVLKSIKDVQTGMYYDTISVGRPVLNTRIYLLDPIGKISRSDVLGEIYVTGLPVTANHTMGIGKHLMSFSDESDGPTTLPNITLEDDHTTASENPMFKILLKTTDYGKFQTNRRDWLCGKSHHGSLTFSGTSESEMIIENYRINTKEIITHIKTCPGVRTCHVMVYRPGTLSKSILAFIVPRPNLTPEAVHNHLCQRIPEYMLPMIIFIGGLPVKNFKVNNAVLVEFYQTEKGCGTKPGSYHEIDVTDTPDQRRATTLFRILNNITGVCEDWTPDHFNWSLEELRIPHTSVPKILRELMRHGYDIELSDFLRVNSITEILKLMESFTPWSPDLLARLVANSSMFEIEVITEKHKNEIIDFFVHGNCGFDFPHSLAYYTCMKKSEVEGVIKGIWPLPVYDCYSIAVRNKQTKGLMAALLNADSRDKDACREFMAALKHHPTKYILEMINKNDGDLLNKGLINPINPRNSLQTLFFLMDTALIDSFEQSVQVMHMLFSELLKVAKEMDFSTTHLTVYDYFYSAFLVETFGFEMVETKQVNMFEAKDGTRPYDLAPDNELCTVLFKSLVN